MMDKGRRRKIFNLIGETFRAQQKYREVVLSLPDAATFPNATACPAVYIARGMEPIEPMTSFEHESRLGFEVIGAVHEPKDLTLALCDWQDHIEETIMSLQHDGSFLALATLISVTGADPTPLSLAPLGIVNPAMPPFGVVRVSGYVLFSYGAF